MGLVGKKAGAGTGKWGADLGKMGAVAEKLGATVGKMGATVQAMGAKVLAMGATVRELGARLGKMGAVAGKWGQRFVIGGSVGKTGPRPSADGVGAKKFSGQGAERRRDGLPKYFQLIPGTT